MSSEADRYLRSHELLSFADSQLVVIDVQDKLVPHIPHCDGLVANCLKLVRAAGVFNIPCQVTEQYPRGLGRTVPELRDVLPAPLDKVRFSSAEVLLQADCVSYAERDQIVLVGIEAHVCVQQTALDLLTQGLRVHVVADAVASRNTYDWKVALRRMADAGVAITTTESVMFEWCEVAGTDEFKQISRLITGRGNSGEAQT